ncbi:hypothetical protein ACO03V_13460 [Microbacterium sp. HMH0099]|uniref:hypothetical protein n=1 Tax=Microbacterium sp. HMH0099 TaxID=3414026 RepID=UPI003BF70255
MVWNIGDIDDSGNEGYLNVGNTTNTNNSSNLVVDLDNVGNTDTSYEETTTEDTTIVDSGNVDSGNTDWDIDGSGNDNSDNSVNGSFNEATDIDVTDSFNTDESWTDASTNAGVREYNTGFEGFGGFGGGAAAIHSSATITDQSVNQNVAATGDVDQFFANSSVTASGEGSVAAGGDVTISQSLDRSTNIDAGGDINIGNSTEIVDIDGSYNESYTTIDITDASQDWSFDNVGNDNSLNVDLTDSFNEDFSTVETENWTINTTEVWGSGNDTVVEVPVVDIDPAV